MEWVDKNWRASRALCAHLVECGTLNLHLHNTNTNANTTLTVKQGGGLGLWDPVERADKNWRASLALCAHLVECLKGEGGVGHMTHTMVMKEDRAHIACVEKAKASVRLDIFHRFYW